MLPPRILASAVLVAPLLAVSPMCASAHPVALMSPRGSGRADLGWQVAQIAASYRGYAYAYVGDTPATGFSCIGFVVWVYRQEGITVPENLSAVYYGYPHVASASIRPGDVLLFANTVWPGLSHAAIYIGHGKMVGADNFSIGVALSSIYEPYWYSRWIGTVRVIPS